MARRKGPAENSWGYTTARSTVLVLVCFVLGTSGVPRSHAATLPPGFSESVIAEGFDLPTALAFLPDGRILVAEKSGVVWMIKNGSVLATPFLDLSSHVNQYWDRGLTAMAVDPNFASNGRVYFFYPYEHDPSDPTGPKTARFTRVVASGDIAGPETVLLGSIAGAGCAAIHPQCIPQDWYGHGAGAIEFAPDGTIFLTVGDASSWDFADARSVRAQNIDQYPGKILRVTPAGEGLPDNPFYDGNPRSIRSRVWAIGMRNPFRIGIRPGTLAPYVGDVGWNDWEEINIATPGANLGWPCYEGFDPQPAFQSRPVCQFLYAFDAGIPPSIVWSHQAIGAAAVGGPFTPDPSSFPEQYHDGFFYADYALNWIRFAAVAPDGDVVGEPLELATDADGPVDLEFGPDGDLYYVAIVSGELRRIRYESPPPSDSGFLSELNPAAAPINGWGPVEMDQSVGELAANDGNPITIGGQVFAKGLGVHAFSDVSFDIGGSCTTFTAVVGVDDEVGANGSVSFEVWDGTSRKLYDSGVRRGSDAGLPISVDVADVQILRLVVTDGGDGRGFDHADWADARVSCEQESDTVFLSDLSPAGQPTNGWGPIEIDQSNGENAAADGNPLTVGGQVFAKGLGVHARSEVTYDLSGSCSRFSAQVGIDDEVGSLGSVVFEVWDDDVRIFASGVRRGSDPPLAVGLDITGADQLTLVVTDGGDGPAYDHADWADAAVLCGDVNQPPRPTILSPSASDLFRVGDVVLVEGGAFDSEDGEIPASDLRWSVTLQHCPGGVCHFHPFVQFTGASGSFEAPDHGSDSFLRIALTAVDSAGASASATLDLQPRTVSFSITSSPPGLQIVFDSGVVTTPFATQAIVGSNHTVEAISPQGNHAFVSWSDGGARQHLIQIPETGLSLAATFTQSSQTSIFLSDLAPVSPPVNGWGPVEIDQSNGESAANDGNPLTIGGQTFSKGIGVHARSEVAYAVPNGCTRFAAQVGVDDEVGANGSVTFEVWNGAAARLFSSGVRRGVDPPLPISVDLTGVAQLRLVATDGGDGPDFDHADWADARLSCGPQ